MARRLAACLLHGLLVATGCAAVREPRTDPMISWEKVRQWYVDWANRPHTGGSYDNTPGGRRRRGETDGDYDMRRWNGPRG